MGQDTCHILLSWHRLSMFFDIILIYSMKEGSTMEEQFREHLMEGEQLLWTGRPESFETLDKTNKPASS